MARVWLFQNARDKQKLGDKAPWFVGWYQGRKKRSKKIGAKSSARIYQASLESKLNSDSIVTAKVLWSDYRAEYLAEVEVHHRPQTALGNRIALDHVERILAPKWLADMTRAAIAKYAATRRTEKHHGRTISEATINKELRSIRAFLREAHKRGYLSNPPTIAFLKEPERIPTYIDHATFAKLYEHAAAAGAAADQGYTAEQWWRAYMVFLYLTGWRAFEPLALTKEDIDWETGRVFLRAEHNKGNRDAMVTLHPVVLEHLAALKTFGPMLFPWDLPRRKLWDRFHLIQEAAGVHKRSGKPFGFHDLRRGFATMNADRMSADALQAIMRHRDYGTTKRYINIARQLNPAVANISVPDLPGKVGGA